MPTAIQREALTINFDGGEGKLKILQANGDVDGRAPRIEELLRVAPGDDLSVQLNVRGPLTGKIVNYQTHAVIVTETKENCKKVEKRQPYDRDDSAPVFVQVGDGKQVSPVLLLEDLGGGVDKLPLKPGQPLAIRMGRVKRVRLELVYNHQDVVFSPRNFLTQAELDQFAEPVLRAMRQRQNYRDVHYIAGNVQPGDVGRQIQVTLRIIRTG